MAFADIRSVGARAGFINGFNAKYADSACVSISTRILAGLTEEEKSYLKPAANK